jgi:hypothetical protein
MVANLSALELSCIDRMTREQVIEAVRGRASDLPADLLERLEEQSTECLQLILLAGRLIHVLQHWRSQR